MNYIEIALNQKFSWRKKTGTSSSGKNTYADPELISGRCSYKLRQLMTASGRVVQSRAQITTLAPVKVDDLIEVDGKPWPVLAVDSPATFAGQIHRRKVVI